MGIGKSRKVFERVSYLIGCLIIHGYTGGPYEVEPLKKHLEAHTNWYIQVPILEGHGKDWKLRETTYETWLDDMEKILIKMKEKCDKIYVVGFSMGGMIAAYLAARQEVDKLVLLSTARKYISFKYMSYYIAEMIEDKFKGKLDENEWYIHYKQKLGKVPFKANIEFLKLVNRTKPYLKEITSPVFIAQGHKDGWVPYKTAYALEEEIGSDKKEVVFFEESNHLICLGDNKDTLIEMILTFLKQPDDNEENSNEEKNKSTQVIE